MTMKRGDYLFNQVWRLMAMGANLYYNKNIIFNTVCLKKLGMTGGRTIGLRPAKQ